MEDLKIDDKIKFYDTCDDEIKEAIYLSDTPSKEYMPMTCKIKHNNITRIIYKSDILEKLGGE